MEFSLPLIDVRGWLALTAVATVVVNPALSLVVLARFRRAVTRGMHTRSNARVGRRRPAPRMASLSRVTSGPLGMPPGPPGTLAALAAHRRRRAILWYAAAGLAFSVTAAHLLPLGTTGLDPLMLAVLVVVYAWPLIVTVVIVMALDARGAACVVGAYFVVLVMLAATRSDGLLGSASAVLLWAVTAGPPTLLAAAVAAPPLRAVGPYLAVTVFLVVAGLSAWPWLAYKMITAGVLPPGASVVFSMLISLALTGCGLLNLRVAAWRYQRKAASEQSILVDQWWLVFALYQVLLQDLTVSTVLGVLLVYTLYQVVVHIGRRSQQRLAAARPGPQLLLLRVFGGRARSERLLRDIGARWRYVGSVQLIAGPDVASANLEPHEFLDYVQGRLSQHFVTSHQELDQRLAQLDVLPDGDGRYRVTDFFCHDDTWQEALRALVDVTDVVLIDLREFTPEKHGVVYELRHLVHQRLLHRVVALVDERTHRPFLEYTLESAAPGAMAQLRTVELPGVASNPSALLDYLEATVAVQAARP